MLLFFLASLKPSELICILKIEVYNFCFLSGHSKATVMTVKKHYWKKKKKRRELIKRKKGTDLILMDLLGSLQKLHFLPS